ncbi:MAG: hypothetical protein M3066_11405 [Actinomycetota bacterium]|nr:hypothetical protein [Actinomycetota bacterium]
MTLRPALGNYASGDRFWDRVREVAEVRSYLTDGQGVVLTGPRRVGKTSVVRRVLEEMSASSVTVFVDVEQHATPGEMFAGIAAALAGADLGFWHRISGWFGKRLGEAADRVEAVQVGLLKIELQAAMAGSWRDDARAIVEAMAGADRPTILAVDELPLLVDRVLKRDRTEAELLMGTLRGLASDFGAVRWLVSGSIGLEPVLQRAGLTGMITHLRAYPIEAWDEATTVGAVEALAATTGLSLFDGAARHVHRQLGLGVPYHVQLLMDELRRDASRRGDHRVSPDDVRRVYRSPFLTSSVRAHLLHLETRLRTVLGEGDALRLARDLLTQAAVAAPLTPDDATVLADDLVEDAGQRLAILREALEILEHDAYLGRDPDGWRFRSRAVCDWWRQGNEMGFVPAKDRRTRRPRP